MIVVIDYGMGNVGSIANMLKKVGAKDVVITNDISDLEKAHKIILPGVGSYDMGMEMLNKYDLINSLNRHVLVEKKPILGICLGMQMLGMHSEEGSSKGLGYIDFENVKFNVSQIGLRVPHMGWNYVHIYNKESKLVKGLEEETRFYFVHSYHAVCKNREDVLMTCEYGGTVTAAVQHQNIYGTQFHPEKSHKFGMQIMKNFVEDCI